QVLTWIQNSRDPVLYLTGGSGTGKSSILGAWVVPKLKRNGHIVIETRGYEQIFDRIKTGILEPGLIWNHPLSSGADLRSVLNRGCQRLGSRRVIIVVDQFEEFLILKDRVQQRAFQEFLSATIIDGLTFLLVFRCEYEGLIQDGAWPKALTK